MKVYLLALQILLVLYNSSLRAQTKTDVEYQDSYGQTISRAKVTTTPAYTPQPYRGSPYVSGVPLDKIMRAGARLQEMYDARIAWLQDRINIAGAFVGKINASGNDGRYYSDRVLAFVNKLNRGKYNLAQNTIFVPLANEILGVYNDMKTDFNEQTGERLNSSSSSISANILNPDGTYKYHSLFTSSPFSAKALLGKNPSQIMRAVEYNDEVSRGVTDEGLNYVAYENADIVVDYFFDTTNSYCYRYRVVAPLIHRAYIEQVLDRNYTRLSDSIYIDKATHIKWRTRTDSDGYFFVRAENKEIYPYSVTPKGRVVGVRPIKD